MAEPTGSAGAPPQLIRSYGQGEFEIAGIRHRGSILIVSGQILPWAVESMAAVTLDSLIPATAQAGTIDLLIFGGGERGQPLAPELRGALRNFGIATESMATGAACRTFNVLLGEGRRVAAALIAIA